MVTCEAEFKDFLYHVGKYFMVNMILNKEMKITVVLMFLIGNNIFVGTKSNDTKRRAAWILGKSQSSTFFPKDTHCLARRLKKSK